MVVKCPADNTALEEQDEFFDFSYFDPHKIGWLICGCAAAITCLFSLITILGHSRNYNRPLEQRQIIRVLLFPPVYAVVSFFSYRYFRYYEYWELAEAAYEAFAIAAFLMLMLQYIGTNVNEQKSVFAKKDKKPLPLPFCCWRYRPSKAYFLVLLKWSVVQYCIIRPAISIAGIVTEYYQVYCPSSYSYQYAYVYLTSVDFAAISIALYGLIVLYTLVKEDLKGKRPLAKFATIKLGIFLIFYQGFIFSLLEKYNVLHATQYWTKTNIANGLNSLCTSCEMVLISAMQMWAFFWGEYYIERVENPMGKANSKGKTNIFLSLIHALNFTDIFVELWWEIVFLFDRMRGKEYTRRDARFDFVQAFGAEDDDDDRNGLGSRSKPAGISQMELTQHDSHLEGQSQPPSSMMEDGTLVNRYDNEKYQNEKLHQKVEPQRGNEFQYNSINNGNEYQMQQVNHHNQNNNGIQYNHPEEEDQYLNNSAATAYTPSTATNQQHLLYPGYGGGGGGVTQNHHQEDNFDHGNQYYSNDYSGGHSRPTSWEPQAL